MRRSGLISGLVVLAALVACERKPVVLSDQLPPLNRAASERVPEMLAADMMIVDDAGEWSTPQGVMLMTWAEGALILAGALDRVAPEPHWLRLQPNASCAAQTDLPRFGPIRGDATAQWKAHLDTGLEGQLTDFERYAVALYASDDTTVLSCGPFSVAVK